ncbi:MAG: T9SS type A sorting domain-containing protein, partial [Balneola sp.]
PNPFNPSTTISYSVGQTGPVNITVYNVMGQKVAELVNATKTAGNNYQISWDATAQASGIYYYRLTAPGQVLTRQMTLIK